MPAVDELRLTDAWGQTKEEGRGGGDGEEEERIILAREGEKERMILAWEGEEEDIGWY